MPGMMTRELGPGNDTCDVSLGELEVVPTQLVSRYPELPAEADWICVDRAFLSAFAGTCLLMLASIIMVLASLEGPEAHAVVPAQVAVVAATNDNRTDRASLSPAANTQDPVAKKQAPRAKRKLRKVAAKAPAKTKVTAHPGKPRRRSLAMR